MKWFEKCESRPRRTEFLVFGQPDLREDDERLILECLRSRWIGQGPRVESFEEEFRAYQGVGHAVAVNSCTAAMHLALITAGAGPGDEVITSSLTFCSTANVIVHVGATPVLVDVEPGSMNLDPAAVEAAVTSRTRAIIPVHFAGRPVRMAEILDIARPRGISVISDAAHAIETEIDGTRVGALGDAVAFSFYVTKNLTTGEGGMLTTSRADWASSWRQLRLHGLSRDAWKRYGSSGRARYECVAPGYKYNMTDLEAALGLAQLRRLEQGAKRREEVWSLYDEALADLPVERPQPPDPKTRHARHLYPVLLDLEKLRADRDEVIEQLRAENIGTGIHFVAVHLHPYYRERFALQPESFPHASRISERTMSLPLSSALTDEDVADVVGSLRRVLGRLAV